jgi:PTH1 family peptidyl-tRNA hydrolase
MKLIVGLGNPGRKYEGTRHNVGFMAAAKVAAGIGASSAKTRFEGEFAEGMSHGEKIAVLCPQTYMNSSGRSVRRAADFFKLSPSQILVVCDDMNLPEGRLRVRPSGSAGGQKGLADIIRHLDTESIARLRIGVGRPPDGWAAADYVLSKIASDERALYEDATSLASDAALAWAAEGVDVAMNRYNGRSAAPPDQSGQAAGRDAV